MGIENDVIYLIEMKSCNISLSDANKALCQLNFTENWLRTNGIPGWNIQIQNSKFVKVFLHDKRGGHCRIYMQAHILFKKEKILRPNITNPKWKRILNFAKTKCQ